MPPAAALPRRPRIGPAPGSRSGSASLSVRLAVVAPLAVLVASALVGPACVSTDPLLEAVEARLGSSSLACGVVLPGDDSSEADSCAVAAFRRGVPFWVRYGACTADGTFESFYLVFTPESLLHVIRYESAPTRATSRFGATRLVVDRPCVPEVFQVTPGHFRIGCRGNVAPQPFVSPALTLLRRGATVPAVRDQDGR